MTTVTQDLKLAVFGDQSLFVRAAIGNVVRETASRRFSRAL